jgi:hypothetical protein
VQLRKHSLRSIVQPYAISSSLTSQFSNQNPVLSFLNHPQSIVLLYLERTYCIRQTIKFHFLMPVLVDSRQENKIRHKGCVIYNYEITVSYMYIYICP